MSVKRYIVRGQQIHTFCAVLPTSPLHHLILFDPSIFAPGSVLATLSLEGLILKELLVLSESLSYANNYASAHCCLSFRITASLKLLGGLDGLIPAVAATYATHLAAFLPVTTQEWASCGSSQPTSSTSTPR